MTSSINGLQRSNASSPRDEKLVLTSTSLNRLRSCDIVRPKIEIEALRSLAKVADKEDDTADRRKAEEDEIASADLAITSIKQEMRQLKRTLCVYMYMYMHIYLYVYT